MKNLKLKKILTKVFQLAFKAINVEKLFFIYPRLTHSCHHLSFSQEGEDVILRRFFEKKKKGFYVDVGAHHPQRFSNTYFFYLQGWRGINIDPIPGMMELFDRLRSGDINLEIGISESGEQLNYYIFNEEALNTFSKELAYQRPAPFKVIKEKKIETYPLAEVLDKYLPSKKEIDFLSVDVEGLDYQVLKSNNWQKYRPKIILIESLKTVNSLEQAINSEITLYLKQQEYEMIAKSYNTLFFKDFK